VASCGGVGESCGGIDFTIFYTIAMEGIKANRRDGTGHLPGEMKEEGRRVNIIITSSSTHFTR